MQPAHIYHKSLILPPTEINMQLTHIGISVAHIRLPVNPNLSQYIKLTDITLQVYNWS